MLQLPLFVVTLFIPLSLSALGSFFIMISYLVFKRAQEPFHKIIFYLAISDLGAAGFWMFAYIVGTSDPFVCVVQGIGIEFFFTASWLWPVIFAIKLYASNVLEKDLNYYWFYHIFVWGIPAIICAVCVFLDKFGPAGYWCWIVESFALQMIFGEFILGATFTCEVILFSAIVIDLIRNTSNFNQVVLDKKSTVRRFSMYLVVPLLCWSWALADRSIQHLTGNSVFWLQVAHGFGSASQGWMNAIVYGWDPDLRRQWRNLLKMNSRRSGVWEKRNGLLLTVNTSLLISETDPPVDFDAKTFYDNLD